MQIEGLNTAPIVPATTPVTPAPAQENQEAPVVAPAAPAAPEDVYEPSGQAPAQNANQYSADIGRMRELWIEHDRQVASFQRMVDALLQRQAERAQQAGGTWDFNDPNAMVDIDEATRAEAQAAIGEGGYFSVEAVATRLLDFAVAISGGDPSRIDVLRNAVQAGFDAAAERWGGELPEISQQTHAAVMEGFDQWQAAGSVSAIALLNRD